MKLSIIIPCFNELKTIEEIIKKIISVIKFDYEIIVVDDFSSDGSRDKIEQIKNIYNLKLIFNEKNYGKGYSVKKGLEKATGDIIIIQDADLEYDPKDYSKLLEPIIYQDADVVYGSRFIGSEKRRVLYFWHSVGNFILTMFSNMLSNLNLTDMENCYKVFKSDVIKKSIYKKTDLDLSQKSQQKSQKNLKIYEVSVNYYGRKYSEGKKLHGEMDLVQLDV